MSYCPACLSPPIQLHVCLRQRLLPPMTQTWKNDSDCIYLSLVLQYACFSAMMYQMITIWSCEGFFLQIYLAAPTIHTPLKHPCAIHLRSVDEIFLEQEAETPRPVYIRQEVTKLRVFRSG